VLLPRALADADPGVRVRALRLVAALGARSLGPEVARRLADPDEEVRTQATSALAALAAAGPDAGGPVAPVAPILTALTGPTATAAAGRGDRVTELLGDALERSARAEDAPKLAQALLAAKGPPAARAAIARGLAAAAAERPLDDPAVIDHLITLLDEGGVVALAAADALGAARLPPGREAPLARAFGDAEPAVQARLCPALVSFEAGRARLGALLAERDLPEEVRAAAAWSVPAPDGGDALRRATDDPAAAVAANARAALAAAARRARGAWVGLRLAAPDGTPWPGRWVVVTAGDGTAIWTMTDSTGRARLGHLPPGPYEMRLPDSELRVTPARASAW
jgi:hypothetical protein